MTTPPTTPVKQGMTRRAWIIYFAGVATGIAVTNVMWMIAVLHY